MATPLTQRRKTHSPLKQDFSRFVSTSIFGSCGTLKSGTLKIESVSHIKRTQLEFEIMSIKSKRWSSEDPTNEALLVLPSSHFKRRGGESFLRLF